jgi:signal peptidase I
MKKSHWVIVILGIIAIPAAIYFIYQQRVAKFFVIPTTSNEPGLRIHSKYLASSLITPEKLDFVVFNFEHELWGEGEWVFRLIAESGDTIQIKDAITFVNSVNIDSNLKLKHSYSLTNNEFQKVENLELHHDSYQIGQDQYIAHLIDSFAVSNGLSQNMEKIKEVDEQILKQYGELWNKDHFGPYIIPEGSFFVLGDNRHNAMDSRYIGVIQVSEIVGVIKN